MGTESVMRAEVSVRVVSSCSLPSPSLHSSDGSYGAQQAIHGCLKKAHSASGLVLWNLPSLVYSLQRAVLLGRSNTYRAAKGLSGGSHVSRTCLTTRVPGGPAAVLTVQEAGQPVPTTPLASGLCGHCRAVWSWGRAGSQVTSSPPPVALGSARLPGRRLGRVPALPVLLLSACWLTAASFLLQAGSKLRL